MKRILFTTLCLVLLVGSFVGANIVEIEADKKKPQILFYKNYGNEVRYIYVSDKEAINEDGEDISKRTYNTVFKGNQIKIYAGSPFYKKQNKWYHTEFETMPTDEFFSMNKTFTIEPIYAVSFFSGQGDGYVEKGINNVWSVVHDAAVGNSARTDLTNSNVESYYSEPDLYRIKRSLIPFDTSSLDNTVNVKSSSLNLYIIGKYNNDDDGNDFVALVDSTTASSTVLSTSDYNEFGATNTPDLISNSIDFGNISTNEYLSFTLSATTTVKRNGETSTCGTENGWTCLGIREGHDINNSAPDVENGNGIGFNTSESIGTSEDPYILVNINTCTYSGSGDWYIKATDNCYLNVDTWVEGDIHILADEGSGSVNLIDDVTIGSYSFNNTSTPINAKAGCKREIYD